MLVKRLLKRKKSHEFLNSRGEYKSRARFLPSYLHDATVFSISSGCNASVKQKMPSETAKEHLNPITSHLYQREHLNGKQHLRVQLRSPVDFLHSAHSL